MRKRLAQPRQAQDETLGKVLFTFPGGLACDLEGVDAEARQYPDTKVIFPSS